MFDNNEEMFPIVDEEGNITGAATRKECHSGSKLLHPVVHLHVFNDKGELYLQKRPAWKDIQPNKWVSRNLVGIIFYTRKVLLTSHYEKRLFEYASQPRVAGSDIRLLSYLWS